MTLPSQNLYYYLVLDCLFVEYAVFGRERDDLGYELNNREIIERLRTALLLTPEELHDGKRTRKVFDAERVNRALRDLERAGLIERLKRGTYQISERGIRIGESNPSIGAIAAVCIDSKNNPGLAKQEITEAFLKWFADEPESEDDRKRAKDCESLLYVHCVGSAPGNQLFEELACEAVGIKTGLRCEPTRYTGDGGIDGNCYDDDGNLVAVIQAKRYRGLKKVNHIPIHQLIGYCATHGVKKGYLVTTSTFAQPALDAMAAESGVDIEGIDGHEFARLMDKSENW